MSWVWYEGFPSKTKFLDCGIILYLVRGFRRPAYHVYWFSLITDRAFTKGVIHARSTALVRQFWIKDYRFYSFLWSWITGAIKIRWLSMTTLHICRACTDGFTSISDETQRSWLQGKQECELRPVQIFKTIGLFSRLWFSFPESSAYGTEWLVSMTVKF